MSSLFSPIKSLALAATLAASISNLSGATYNVDFEGSGETKTAYSSANVTLNGIAWNLTEALIGDSTTDYKVGARSARLRGYTASAMTMQADKADGAGTISFTYQRYGTDAQIAWAVEISSNGGSSWTQVGTDFTAPAVSTPQTFSESVNIAGNVRVRIIAKATNASNKRLNIDNISITDYSSGPDTTPPTITTYSPADDATGVALNSNLVATFSEPVAVGTGSVRLYASGNPTPIQTFTPTAGNISGAVVTLDPTADLAAGTSYYVQIDAGAFTDLAANNFAGIADTTTWNFATVAADTTPPTVATLSPANSATGVAVDANLAVTFSEPVLASTGNVKLYAVGNPTPVATFAASSGSIVGNTVTFDPPTNLNGGSAYYVQIEATAFTDTATPANTFAGILDTTTWTFTTAGADTTAPLVVTLSPANNATNVALDASLTLTFNEPIAVGTGNLRIYQVGTPDTLVETIAAGDSGVEAANAFLNPNTDFVPGSTYYIQVDAGTFTDIAGNPMAAITGTTSWTFGTIPPDTTAPVVTGATPVNGATDVPLTQNLTVSFDEPIAAGTGNILIKKTSDNSTVATLDVTNAGQVVISASQASLVPGSLPPNATLYVEIPAGAFTDTSSNPAPAYGGSGVWSFSTVTVPELTSAGPYTQDFSTFTSATNLTDGRPLLPNGWIVTAEGAAGDFSYDGDFGTGTAGGFRGNANVLGYQHSSSTGTLVETLTLVNSTGTTITDLTISYTGRAGRVDDLTATRYPAFTVKVAGSVATGLAYSTTGTENSKAVTGSVGSLSISPGAAFTITWSSDRGAGSNSSRQIGLSNVSVSVGSAALPPSLAGVTFNYSTLSSTSVSASSEVTDIGGSALTARGLVYAVAATNPAPEIGGTGVTQIPDSATTIGTFGASLTGLVAGTQYSVRSYATNAQGTSYSSAFTIHTLVTAPSLVTSYTQAFNAFSGTILDGTLPAGWSVVSTGGLNGYAGPWGPATTSGGLLGGVSSPGVLGYQHVTTSGTATATLTLTNATGSTLTELWISYLGRVSRTSETRFPVWAVAVNGTPVPELAYSTGTGSDETKTHHLTGLSIASGASFTISWVSDRGLPSGTSRQIGIANVYVGLSAPTTGYSGWAGANVGGQTPDQDYDGDGIDNGAEYFMGTAGNAFTTNPGIAANGKITWPMNPDATGVSYKVMTSENLTSWTQATSGVQVVGGNLEFTVPTTTTKLFVRLEVTVN